MKTILVATDFSPAADNAANFALHLAKGAGTGLKLCSAFNAPIETPMEAQLDWPPADYDSLKTKTTENLRLLSEKLTKVELEGADTRNSMPGIEFISELGPVYEVITKIVKDQELSFVVMGLRGAGIVSRAVFGSNTHDMIEKASFPVLIVPANAKFSGLIKIAFATDLSHTDINVLQSLSGLARQFNAEIFVAHVTNEKFEDYQHQHKVNSFLNDITNKINYPKIYFRRVKSMDIEHGLGWLSVYGQIDLLVMVHRKHNVLDEVFEGSHTQKLARHIQIPLLVFPSDYKAAIV